MLSIAYIVFFMFSLTIIATTIFENQMFPLFMVLSRQRPPTQQLISLCNTTSWIKEKKILVRLQNDDSQYYLTYKRCSRNDLFQAEQRRDTRTRWLHRQFKWRTTRRLCRANSWLPDSSSGHVQRQSVHVSRHCDRHREPRRPLPQHHSAAWDRSPYKRHSWCKSRGHSSWRRSQS